MNLTPNLNKNLVIEVRGKKYARYPVKTHLITPQDKNPTELVKKYTQDFLQKGDIVFISEKIIAIMQGRAYPLSEIKPSKIAVWLSKKVYKNPGGIGLASPQTMQLAIEEVGLWRILIAAFLAAITKPLGIKGLFYLIAGDQARGIDGAVPYAIPPYNTYVSKAPFRPQKVVQEVSRVLGCPTAIVDANDFGVRILGASNPPAIACGSGRWRAGGIDRKFLAEAIKDNPLGQSSESTPIGILREINE